MDWTRKANPVKPPDDNRASFPIILKYPPIRISVGSLILISSLILRSEVVTTPRKNSEGLVVSNQPSSLSLRVAQARKHPSYQVFKHNLTLPSIKVIDAATLEVGGKLKIELNRPEQLSMQARLTLTNEFQVPLAVVDRLWERIFKNTSPNAEQVTNALRMTVLDYKYLQQRWTRYRPPKEKEGIKTDAFQALQAGDLDKAWELYLDLPKPPAPPGLKPSEKGKGVRKGISPNNSESIRE
jgi:hypothetical protein